MFKTADKTVRKGIRTDSWFSYWDHTNRSTRWSLGPFELHRSHVTPIDRGLDTLWSESTKWSFKMEFKWGDWIVK